MYHSIFSGHVMCSHASGSYTERERPGGLSQKKRHISFLKSREKRLWYGCRPHQINWNNCENRSDKAPLISPGPRIASGGTTMCCQWLAVCVQWWYWATWVRVWICVVERIRTPKSEEISIVYIIVTFFWERASLVPLFNYVISSNLICYTRCC